MGLFTKSKGEGWSLDKWNGTLTISGDLGDVVLPFEDIRKKVRSVVALKGARIKHGCHLFSDMENLKSADLSELDVSGCDDVSYMFNNCKSLVSLDLSSWDIRKVQSMEGMFLGCHILRKLSLNGWDVHKVGDMASLFSNCRNLETLDLTGWHVSKSTKTRRMFNNVAQTADVIADDESVVRLLKESREQKESRSSDKAHSKGNKNDPSEAELEAALDYLEQMESKGKKVAAQAAAVLGERSSVAEPAGNLQADPKPAPAPEPISGEGWAFDEESGRLTINGDLGDVFHPFEIITDKVVSVVAQKGAVVRNGSELFLHMSNLTKAELSELDVSKCESINCMFAGCSLLAFLDLKGWNTANISDMGGLFQECESLTSLDLTSWNIANVKDMSFMFFECEALESIKTGPMWIPKNVCDTTEMFECCYSLRELDISVWPSASLESCSAMFWNCESLTELDLSSMDISGIDDISCMFYGCASLRSLKLGGWDTHNVNDMKELFSGCANLETLDLTGWRVNEGTDTESMFEEVPQRVHVFADDETLIRLLPEGVKMERGESAVIQTKQKSKVEPVLASKPQPEAKTQTKPVQNPEERFAVLRERVKNNDGEATYQLALCFRDGVGTERNEYQYLSLLIRAERLRNKDSVEEMGKVSEDRFYEYGNILYEQKRYKEAFYFYLTAARRGMVQAWYDAGFQLEKGQGMDKNPAKAAEFYERGAEKGNAVSAWSLANMYSSGEGLSKDEAESFRWRLRSAELGHVEAMWFVAVSYYYGNDGAEKNYEQALIWAKKAKESGKLPVDTPVDKLIQDIEEHIIDDTFSAAGAAYQSGNHTEAARLFQIAAEKGNASAAFALASIYTLGEGVPTDYEQALYWAKKAKESEEFSEDKQIDVVIQEIEKGIAGSAYNIGMKAFKVGDYTEAIRQFQKAAEYGDGDAAWNLAVMYAKGEGASKDSNQALIWAKKAKESGKLSADKKIDELIKALEREVVRNKFRNEAQKRAEAGDVEAMFILAGNYFYGIAGVEKNSVQSFFWAAKAKKSGKLDAEKTKILDSIVNAVEATREYIKPEEIEEIFGKESSGIAKAIANDINFVVEYMESCKNDIDAETMELLFLKLPPLNEGYVDLDTFHKLSNEEKSAFLIKCSTYFRGMKHFIGSIVVKQGVKYLKGDVIERNFNTGMELFEKAVDENSAQAEIDKMQRETWVGLGKIYLVGSDGVKQDFSKAKELFEKAAEKGSPAGQVMLGRMYYNGEGVSRNRTKAKELFQKAAGQGNEEAKKILRQYY